MRFETGAAQDLHRYQQQVDADDAYDNALDACIEALMKPGQQCDPYEADNFFEARSTVESDDLNLPKGRVDPVQYAAAELRLIVAYWTRMATLQAECELAEPTLNEPDDDDE